MLKAKKIGAKELVEKTLSDMVGDIPPSHRRIVSAVFDSRTHVIATLEMFDQRPATVELTQWAFGWSVRYSNLPGGNVMWTGSQWQRDTT